MSLELKGITKKFVDLVANDSINLKVNDSEILAILGENGAGKSTLMNIVYGLLSADSGEILIDGQKVEINSLQMHLQLESAWSTNTLCWCLCLQWQKISY